MSDWHSRPLEQVMKELDSRPSGLTERESAQRLERLGPNQLEPPRKPSVLARVLGQLKDPMILVLLGAAALSLAASGGEDWLDGAIILIIVLVNGVISITQEDHAQQALEELRRMSSPQAHVLREGRAKKISAAALVPGDVILLEAGDMVPADARVMECSRLQADESAMTGESVPVEKGAHDRLPEEAALGDHDHRRPRDRPGGGHGDGHPDGADRQPASGGQGGRHAAPAKNGGDLQIPVLPVPVGVRCHVRGGTDPGKKYAGYVSYRRIPGGSCHS